MSMLQLNPPLRVTTPKGKADAHVLINPGQESNLQWVTFNAQGECWTYLNKDIRLDDNATMGRLTHIKTIAETLGDNGSK